MYVTDIPRYEDAQWHCTHISYGVFGNEIVFRCMLVLFNILVLCLCYLCISVYVNIYYMYSIRAYVPTYIYREKERGQCSFYVCIVALVCICMCMYVYTCAYLSRANSVLVVRGHAQRFHFVWLSIFINICLFLNHFGSDRLIMRLHKENRFCQNSSGQPYVIFVHFSGQNYSLRLESRV